MRSAAELMDGIYRRQRHIYDPTRKYFLLGRDLLIDRLRAEAGGCVLEIGCGTGRNLIHAARLYPRAQFFGIDVSAQMLATAQGAVQRAGLGNCVRLACADATQFDPEQIFGRRQFSRVLISYSLSMIPGWRASLDRAMALLAPAGELHVVDFGGQHGLPDWFRAGLRRWLAYFHVNPRDDLEPELAKLAMHYGATLKVERPYRGYAQYVVARMPGSIGADPRSRLVLARIAGLL